jgi:broad specificity phosphatase PhoE
MFATVDHELFLLRHGQTEWSVNGRHTGRTDIPLTAAGENQARAAGLTLSGLRKGPALVLTSPRQRAVRTAELAGLVVDESTEDLAEWDYGDYEGVTTSEVRKTVPDWTVWTGPVPGGETAAQVAARADRLLERVRSALADTEVILVGHGHFSRALVARWLGLPTAAGVHFGLDPAGVSVLGDERGEPKIEHLNIPPS